MSGTGDLSEGLYDPTGVHKPFGEKINVVSDKARKHYNVQQLALQDKIHKENAKPDYESEICIYKPDEIISISKKDFKQAHGAYKEISRLLGMYDPRHYTEEEILEKEIFSNIHCEILWKNAKKRSYNYQAEKQKKAIKRRKAISKQSRILRENRKNILRGFGAHKESSESINEPQVNINYF